MIPERPFDSDKLKEYLAKVFSIMPSDADLKTFQNVLLEYGWTCSLKPLNSPEFLGIVRELLNQPEVVNFGAVLESHGIDTDYYLSWAKKLLFESIRCRKVCKKIIIG